MNFHVVIPARRASERLPGKPLLLIAGEPMVVHVWRNANLSGAAEVIVATDDDEVAAAARTAGAVAMLTRSDHASGSDRIAEVCEARGWAADEIVINVQGDEPLLPPALIGQVAALLAAEPAAAMATLAMPIADAADIDNPNVVKVVVDGAGRALYFSRAAVPHLRDPDDPGQRGLYRRHIGIYAYRVAALRALVRSAPVPLERAERLEQLRALHLGLTILVADAAESPGHGVDTPADLERVRSLLERN